MRNQAPSSIIIPMGESDNQLAMAFSIESTANSVTGENGQSLSSCLNEFVSASPIMRKVMDCVEEAEQVHINTICALHLHLSRSGFECEMIECHGLRRKIHECSELMESAIRYAGEKSISASMLHYAIRVGNIVIDPGYLRFGPKYGHSNNTTNSEFATRWAKIVTVPGSASNSTAAFIAHYQRQFARTEYSKALAELQESKSVDPEGADKGSLSTVFSANQALASAFESVGPRPKRKMRQTSQ